jgi:hypothetical protein
MRGDTRTPKEIAKSIVNIGKRNRTCSLCERKIFPGIKHLSISKGGYSYWNICKSCFSLIEEELHKN